MRGPRRQFTHSKVMAWVAFDRAIKGVESLGLSGPVDEWRELRAVIHADICRNGFDRVKNSFVQYYGGQGVDAASLLIPQVGFLPPDDARVRGTVAAIERELMVDGLVLRYRTEQNLDGLKDKLFRLELRRQAGTVSEEEYLRERTQAEKILRELVGR